MDHADEAREHKRADGEGGGTRRRREGRERDRGGDDDAKRSRSESPSQTVVAVKRLRAAHGHEKEGRDRRRDGSAEKEQSRERDREGRKERDRDRRQIVVQTTSAGKVFSHPKRRDAGGSESFLKQAGEKEERDEKRDRRRRQQQQAAEGEEGGGAGRESSRRARLLTIVGDAEELKPPKPDAKTGHNRGVVWYIATGGDKRHRWQNPYQEGVINASASTTGQGDVAQVLNYKFDREAQFATIDNGGRGREGDSNPKPSYVAFDFTDWEVLPTFYSVAHAYDYPVNHMRSWSLRGSEDNYRWDILSKHQHDETLNAE